MCRFYSPGSLFIPSLNCFSMILLSINAIMKPSIAVSLLLVAGASFGGASKQTMKIKKDGVRFKVSWWNDGRDVPYNIYFKDSGVKAHH